mgnify:CR=1 FL=1
MKKSYDISSVVIEIPDKFLNLKNSEEMLDKLSANMDKVEDLMEKVTIMAEKGEWICNYPEYYEELWHIIKELRKIESMWLEKLERNNKKLIEFGKLIDKIVEATEYGSQIEFRIKDV